MSAKEFGGEEQWKNHYMEVVSSEKMQRNYAKVVELYGGKDAYLSVANNPVSKEVAESYNKRIDHILRQLAAKQGCAVESFEVKEIIGEYGFVMKQFTQVKNEKGVMLAVAHSYRDERYKKKLDEMYGEGAADFFAEAIEMFYNND